jgi:hypothetical protein
MWIITQRNAKPADQIRARCFLPFELSVLRISVWNCARLLLSRIVLRGQGLRDWLIRGPMSPTECQNN